MNKNIIMILILIVITSGSFILAQEEEDYEIYQLGEAFIYWSDESIAEVFDYSDGFFIYYEESGSHFYSVDLPTYEDEWDYHAPFFIDISHNAFNMVWAMEDPGTTTTIDIFDAETYDVLYSETIYDYLSDDDYLINVEYQISKSGYRLLSKIEFMKDIELNDDYTLGEGTYFTFQFDQNEYH
jgi:hypothetical protein